MRKSPTPSGFFTLRLPLTGKVSRRRVPMCEQCECMGFGRCATDEEIMSISVCFYNKKPLGAAEGL